MSRDQKPGRIRVIAGERPPEAQAVSVSARTPGSAEPGTAEAPAVAEARSGGLSWQAGLIFLGSCAVGGAGFIAISGGF